MRMRNRQTAHTNDLRGGNVYKLLKPNSWLVKAAVVIALLTSTAASAANKPYKIAVSNSYIGNGWRVEALNQLAAYAKKAYPDTVQLTINSSGEDVQNQIAAIQNMISQGVDAILIDPQSDTALSPVIADAISQGIVVVAWDEPLTAPGAYTMSVDFQRLEGINAQWLADTLKGKGNVIINRGVAGTPADRDMYNGAMEVFKKYPDIHVVT